MAFTALPLMAFEEKVCSNERMSSYAMRLPRKAGGQTYPAQRVGSVGNRLKVGRVDAGAVAAEVVKCQAIRDGAYPCFVGKAVGLPLLATGQVKLAIALTVTAPDPDPAGIGAIDLGFESLQRIADLSRHGPLVKERKWGAHPRVYGARGIRRLPLISSPIRLRTLALTRPKGSRWYIRCPAPVSATPSLYRGA